MRGVRLLAALLAIVLAAPSVAVAAQVKLTDVEDEVMCTVCGVPLSLAREAPAAKRERALILQLIAEGKSKQQIKDELVATYGEEVLAVPKSSGFDLAAWLVPAALFLVAGLALAVTLRGWRRRTDGGTHGEPPARLSDDDAERVAKALGESD
jgi:cytochrome c-type biogenesis protein CcmH